MTIVRGKPHEEDSSLHDLLRIRELERQNKQKRYENDAVSANDKQKIKSHQSSSDSTVQCGSNTAALSDVSKRASELDLVIEIDNGETSHI